MKIILSIILLAISINLSAQKDKASFKKINKALKLIETQYVDTVNSAAIATAAVKAMVKQLDPHSKYLSAESLKKNNEVLNGSFAGVGIHYQILKDTLIVLNVVADGPAQKAGVKAGDKLIEIDSESVVGKSVNNTLFSKKLRGKKDSKVKLKVIRHASREIKDIEITRGSIPINTLQTSYMINKNTGFIRIKNFSRTTNYEFQIAVMQMQMNGMKNLIIDLRNNPGGLMMASIRLADAFLEDGKLIVYTQGSHSPRTEYKATVGGQMETGKLIVLIDENSASASEIFAGAIQDWDRGLILGRRSFGKGLVGRNYTLPDGSAVRLTTGRYYTPSGRCIQKSYENGNDQYNKDLLRRYEHGEIYSADSVHFSDSLKYYTDSKRLVYGGGAIMPDKFYSMDTTYNSEYLRLLNRYGMINYYAGIYFDNNLEDLNKKYPNFEKFNKEFSMSDDMIVAMNDLAFEKYKIKGNEEDINTSKEYIITMFKAYLARDLFKNGSYYQISNQIDKMVIEASNMIKGNRAFKLHGIHD